MAEDGSKAVQRPMLTGRPLQGSSWSSALTFRLRNRHQNDRVTPRFETGVAVKMAQTKRKSPGPAAKKIGKDSNHGATSCRSKLHHVGPCARVGPNLVAKHFVRLAGAIALTFVSRAHDSSTAVLG